MRAFLAVPADPGWVDSARKLVQQLKPELPVASWTRPESWHLTLKFLGEISAEALDRFAGAMGDSIGRTCGGELWRGGAIVFPPRGRPRVLGVGFADGSTALASLRELASTAARASRRVGKATESRPFHPHVTLARIRKPWPAADVESFRSAAERWEFPQWPVRSLVIFESRLEPSGAIHAPLREWAMAQAGATVPA
ncbi:MAG: RNA 2',3'-cyclic phosphodiesterase [Acidobacteriota bacterium]